MNITRIISTVFFLSPFQNFQILNSPQSKMLVKKFSIENSFLYLRSLLPRNEDEKLRSLLSSESRLDGVGKSQLDRFNGVPSSSSSSQLVRDGVST